MTAVTAETTAAEFAAELRQLADRVERATSWAALRESLDALTPTLRSTRGRVVRHTRAPKAAPAERPAPAPKDEPAKVAAPAPVTAEPKAAPKPPAPAATAPPKTTAKPAPVVTPPVPARARCPGTFRVVVAGLLLSAWWAIGARLHDVSWRLRRRYRNAVRPIRWALGDAADWVAWARDRAAARLAVVGSRAASIIRRRP